MGSVAEGALRGAGLEALSLLSTRAGKKKKHSV